MDNFLPISSEEGWVHNKACLPDFQDIPTAVLLRTNPGIIPSPMEELLLTRIVWIFQFRRPLIADDLVSGVNLQPITQAVTKISSALLR